MKRFIDETGNVYGTLKVIQRVPGLFGGSIKWVCICECGVVVTRYGSQLRKSVGFVHCGDFEKHGSMRPPKHGHAKQGKLSATYNTWRGMKDRCLNPNHKNADIYGKVKLDPSWLEFDSFLADMGERPPGYSLDRIDIDGPYAKENCRWATHTTQVRHTHMRKDCPFGYIGVSQAPSQSRGLRNKTRGYRAKIRVNKQDIGLGTFPSPELAAMAYNRAARKYHGSDAKQNTVPALDYYRQQLVLENPS